MHSSDTKPSVIETVKTISEAKKIISYEIKELSKTSLPYSIRKLGDVTCIKFIGHELNPAYYTGPDWSIGFWFEKISKKENK